MVGKIFLAKIYIKEIGELQRTTFNEVMKKVCESLACQSYIKP